MKKLILTSLALMLMVGIFAYEITIGTDATPNNVLINSSFGYCRDASIYTASEIGAFGTISTIAYRALTNTTVAIPIKVYLKTTSAVSLAPAVPWANLISGLTPVYEGIVSGTSASLWKTIALTTPFDYSADNLEVLIESNYGGSGSGSATVPKWYASYAASRNQQIYDNYNPPTDPGHIRSIRANIRLEISGPPPILTLNHDSWDFGDVLINTAVTEQFTITNTGSGTLIIYSISPYNLQHSQFSISAAATDTELSSGESTSFTVQYLPTAGGLDQTDNLVIGHSTGSRTIALSGDCYNLSTTTPYFEGFETGHTDQSNSLQHWTQATGPQYTSQRWTANSSLTDNNRTPRTGNWNAYLAKGGQSCLIRAIHLTAGTDYYIKLFARQNTNISATDASIQVKYGTQASIAGMTETIIPETSLPSGDYQMLYGTFSPATTGIYQIGIQGWINYNADYISLDDITIAELPASPVLSYNPTAIDFGEVIKSIQTGPRNVIITNTGTGNLNIAAEDISIIGADAVRFSFGTGHLPASISSGHSVEIPVYVNSTVNGTISATLRIVNNQTRANYDVGLSASVLPAGFVTIGNDIGGEFTGLPIYPNWDYSYSQSIYLQSEINYPSQGIEKLYYYWNGGANAYFSNNWTIYMGHTTLSTFENNSSWIPLSELTQVSQPIVNLPARAGWIQISLPTPFLYNNIDNLVIAVDENESGNNHGQGEMYFYCSDSGGRRSIRCESDTDNPNPASPPPGFVWHIRPNLKLKLIEPASTQITIGTGTGSGQDPISSYYGFHRSAAIYPAGELGGSGKITKIEFKAERSTVTAIPIKVYMRMTPAFTLLPSDWPTLISGLTPVYEGNLLGTTAGQWKTIALDIPFDYTGNNLEVLIESNYGGSGGGISTSPKWYNSTALNKNLYIYQDDNAPTTKIGTVNSERPDIRLQFDEYLPYPPAFAASPTSLDFGNISINTTAAYTDISIFNNGAGTLTITSADLGGGDAARFLFDLNSNPLPWILGAGASKIVKVAFSPIAVGSHSAYLHFVCTGLGSHDLALTGTGTAITEFPTVFDFGTLSSDAFPPLVWSRHSGVLANPTILGAAGTGSWVQDDWKNISSPANKAARINIYGTSANGWLISPPIAVPAADYEVSFDVAYMAFGNNNAPVATGTDDQFAVLIGDGSSWTPAKILRKWDNAGSPYVLNSIPPAGIKVSLPLGSAGIKYLAFYGISTVSNADNDLMVDNITFRQIPTTPLLTLSPDLAVWDFGHNAINTAATKQFTITNTGVGTLILSSIVASGAYYSISVAPADLELSIGESTSFTVQYLPTAVGTDHTGVLTISDNRAIRTIDLIGSCSNPTIASFPCVEGFETGNTDQSTTVKNWTQANGPEYTDKYWKANSSLTNYNRAPRTGAWNVCLQRNGQSYLIRPIVLVAGTGYSVELYARQDGTVASHAKIQVKYGSTASVAGMTQSIIPSTGLVNGDYQRLYGVFTPASSGTYYIGIQGWMDGYYDYISLDDITIDMVPTSPVLNYRPESLNFAATFPNSQSDYQNLTVSNYGGGTLNLAAANISLVGPDADQFAFTTTGFPAALTLGQSVNIPLRFVPSSAGYKSAALRLRYAGADYDVDLGGYAPSEIALYEGFEAGVIPSTWTILNVDNGSKLWLAQTSDPHTGTFAARVNYEGSSFANNDWLITPPVQLSATAHDEISFWMRSRGASYDDAWEVLISTTDTTPASFSMIDEGTGHMPEYVQKSYNLDSYGDAIIYLAVRYIGTNDNFLTVDDFVGPDLYSPIVKDFPWSEGFEAATFPPQAWSRLDADADSENWYRWGDDGAANNGDYYAASASWTEPNGPLAQDNWLITPALAIPELGAYMVEYYVGASDPGHPGEHYSFCVSTTGTAAADFSILEEENIEEEGWHYRMFDLSSYAGQTLYLAFRHHSTPSSSCLKIDDIVIRELPATPILSYRPAAWYFGSTHTLTPSTPKDFVLKNNGNGSITINSGDITLNDPEGNFVLTAQNLPVSLGYQQTYIFSVQFIAQSAGSKTATLSIQDNISSAIHHIQLFGEASLEPIVSILGLTGAAVAPNNVSLSWSSMFGNPGTPGYLHWDDAIPRDTQGILGGTNYNVASKFGTDVTARAAGMKLKSVMIHLDESPQAVDAIKVWKGSNSVLAPTHLLYTQPVSGLVSGWNNIVLTTPLTVSGSTALYVGYHMTSAVDAYVASTDYLPAVPGRGNLLDYMGWSTLTDYNRSGNWLIHPYFEAASAKTSGDPELIKPISMYSEPAREHDLHESLLIARPNPEAERALLGFNIYRNGVKINSSIVPDYYYLDEDLAAGSYQYAVQSVHHGALGPVSSSIPVTIQTLPAPLALPFTETWSSGNFATKLWSTSSSNWAIKSNLGNPGATASFSSNPTVWNYSSVLRSYSFNATAMHSLQFSFDLSLDNASTYTENLMTWQIWNGSSWYTLGSYSSVNDDLAWTHYSYDISAYAANQIFKIRFVASGVSSHAINAWYIDNIAISNSNPVLTPVTGLSLQHPGSSTIVSWTAVPGASSYSVYLSEDPYRGYLLYGTTVNTQLSILQSELPEFKAFFKVIANAGPLPGATEPSSPPAQLNPLK